MPASPVQTAPSCRIAYSTGGCCVNPSSRGDSRKAEEIHDITAEFVGGGRNNCVLNEPYLVDALEASSLFDLIVDSHTHKLELRRESTLVVNPGEAGGWVTGRCTVGIVDLVGMDVEVVDL